jgi:hypothetical protein
MTVVAFPLNAVSGAPSYTGRMLRETLGTLLAGATTARPLGGHSGVRPGTPTTTVSLSGSTWTCGEHGGVIDAESAGEAGSYFYAVSASETGSLDAADATNPRKDILSVQISDPAESDGTSVPGGAILYTAGAPAAIPDVPATPARSLKLAEFSVPKSGGGSPTVTWVAPYLSAAGAPLLALTKALLDTITGSFTGQLGTVFNDTTTANNITYRWSGTAWKPAIRDTFVVPSSVSVGSGSYVINPDGSVTITGASSVTFNGVHPANVIHTACDVEIDTATVSTTLNARMVAGGTPQTGTDYRYEVGIFKGTTTTAPANGVSVSSAQLSDSGLSFYGTIHFYNANKATATYLMTDLVAGVSGVAPTRTTAAALHGVSSAMDGVQFIPNAGGTITGTFSFRSL